MILRHEGIILRPLDTQSLNDTKQRASSFTRDNMPSAGTTDFTDHVQFTKIIVHVCVLLIIWPLQTSLTDAILE